LKVLHIQFTGVACGHFRVVGDQEQGSSGLAEVIVNEGECQVTSFAVERGRGFVGEEQGRRGDECPQKSDALAFALGELGGGPLQEVGDLQAFGQGGQRIAQAFPLGRVDILEAGRKEDILGGGEVVEESEILENEACVFESPSADS
jgi:hypothetical protein